MELTQGFFVLLGYLIGSIPFSWIFAKLFKGVDISKIGSKNIGATNVLRTAGIVAGAFAFLGDYLKAVVPLLLTKIFLTEKSLPLLLIFGVFIIIGHDFSIFANFKGGKGIATTFGFLTVLDIRIAFISFLIWILILIFSRYVSLASIIFLFSLPLIVFLFHNIGDFFWLSILLSLLGITRHGSNIVRLIKKEESKLDKSYFKKK